MQEENQDWTYVQQFLEFIPDTLRSWVLPLLLGVIIGSILLRWVLNPLLMFANNLHLLSERRRKSVLPPASDQGESLRPDVKVLRDVWLKDREPNSIRKTEASTTRTRVLTVLNMKGGVGKTTLCANLGAAFNELGKRVLFVDYDYQGSLSLMVAGSFNGTRRDVGVDSYKTLYPQEQSDSKDAITSLPGRLSGCGISGASYHLFRDEMEQFSKWSAGDLKYDVRTQFKEFVRTNTVQNEYDIVLVDCGPRFTTTTINALCGSTHFIVPTILDELSGQAVAFLDNELSKFQDELFPNLRLVGVIPTFVHHDPRESPKFNARESEQIDTLRHTFSAYTKSSPLLLGARIPRRNEISKCSDKIVYYHSDDARRIFKRAAEKILERM